MDSSSAVTMLSQFRQGVIRESQGGAAVRPTPTWAYLRRLITAHERLRPETFAGMWNSLIDDGDPGVQIWQAFVVMEALRALPNLSGTNPECHLIRTPRELVPASGSHRRARDTSPGRLHRRVVSGDRRGDPSRVQRQILGLHPRLAKHQRRNAFGPQPSQPTPTDAVVFYSPGPAGLSREKHAARLSLICPLSGQVPCRGAFYGAEVL